MNSNFNQTSVNNQSKQLNSFKMDSNYDKGMSHTNYVPLYSNQQLVNQVSANEEKNSSESHDIRISDGYLQFDSNSETAPDNRNLVSKNSVSIGSVPENNLTSISDSNSLFSSTINTSAASKVVKSSALIHANTSKVDEIFSNSNLKNDHSMASNINNDQDLMHGRQINRKNYVSDSSSAAISSTGDNMRATSTTHTKTILSKSKSSTDNQLREKTSIHVSYVNQNGKQFNKKVTGYVGNNGVDITKLAHLPAGYHLDSGQKISYKFTNRYQSQILHIIGKPATGKVNVTIITTNGTAHKEVVESGLVGNTYTIDPDAYAPKGYRSDQKNVELVRHFTADGKIDKKQVFYNYIPKNDNNKLEASPIRVTYQNQNGSKSVIYAFGKLGQSGDDITKLANIPGYHLAKGQDASYTITDHSQNMQLRIVGNQVSGEIGVNITMINGEQRHTIHKKIKKVGLVGDSYTIYPDDFTPQGYRPDKSDKDFKEPFVPEGIDKDNSSVSYSYVIDNSHRQINYFSKSSFNHKPKTASLTSITVIYVNQNGIKFTNNVSGHINQNGMDITQLVNLPAGYHLNNHQDKSYQFTSVPQNKILYITGNQVFGKVDLIIIKVNHNQQTTTHQEIPETGLVGNVYTVNPENHIPQGYRLSQNDHKLSGSFLVNGINKSKIAYIYLANHDQEKAITRNVQVPVYVNNVASGLQTVLITGTVGQNINLTKVMLDGKVGYTSSAVGYVTVKSNEDVVHGRFNYVSIPTSTELIDKTNRDNNNIYQGTVYIVYIDSQNHIVDYQSRSGAGNTRFPLDDYLNNVPAGYRFNRIITGANIHKFSDEVQNLIIAISPIKSDNKSVNRSAITSTSSHTNSSAS